eukprot:3411586-Amphidinium_carterae.3
MVSAVVSSETDSMISNKVSDIVHGRKGVTLSCVQHCLKHKRIQQSNDMPLDAPSSYRVVPIMQVMQPSSSAVGTTAAAVSALRIDSLL